MPYGEAAKQELLNHAKKPGLSLPPHNITNDAAYRGVDAPEQGMPYGEAAKQELLNHAKKPGLSLPPHNITNDAAYMGVDAPEQGMPYGEAAKQELLHMIQGKTLNIHVYEQDQYARLVGDVYCKGTLIQEQLLKRGCAWHYAAYDHRPEFTTVGKGGEYCWKRLVGFAGS